MEHYLPLKIKKTPKSLQAPYQKLGKEQGESYFPWILH